MTDTTEKYQSILSHIETLNMPEGQYLALANAIRDVRNKHSDDKSVIWPWKPLEDTIKITIRTLSTSMYDRIEIDFTTLKMNIPSNGARKYYSAKGEIRYYKQYVSTPGARLEFNTKNSERMLCSLFEDFHPEDVSYYCGFKHNEWSIYTLADAIKQHNQQMHDAGLLHEFEDDDDSDDSLFQKTETPYAVINESIQSTMNYFYHHH